MEFIQDENRVYTIFAEKIEHLIDLLAEPKNLDYDSMLECQKDSVHSGINLEQPICNVISSMHLLVEHKNDFRNVYTYCGQRGIDLISIDKHGKKWLIEATNPKYTTSLGIKAWLEKIVRFLKIDPQHKHIWAIVISHVNAKTVPFKIKCLMYKLKIRLIDLKLTATSHNYEYVMGSLRSKLNSGYDYFSASPKVTAKITKVLNSITNTSKFKSLSNIAKSVTNLTNRIVSKVSNNIDSNSKSININKSKIESNNVSRKSLHVPYFHNTAYPIALCIAHFLLSFKNSFRTLISVLRGKLDGKRCKDLFDTLCIQYKLKKHKGKTKA